MKGTHMRTYVAAVALTLAVLACTAPGHAQNLSLGGNMGLSMLDRSAGFHLTPMAELFFNRNAAVGSEFSINTQYGMPLIWHAYFNYYFGIPGSHVKPYARAGPLLAANVPNGPCFGILFGGGVNIPLAHRLYLAPDVRLGPIFGFGGGTSLSSCKDTIGESTPTV